MFDTYVFDLDGTLLPMDTDVFMKRYFKALGAFAAENGLDSDMCLGAVMAGMKAMANSDGRATNHDVFWEAFTKTTGLDAEEMRTLFSRFYEGPFSQVGEGVQANPEAARAVAALKGKGYRVAVTTLPMFPLAAVHSLRGPRPRRFRIRHRLRDLLCRETHAPLLRRLPGARRRCGRRGAHGGQP